MVAPWKSHVSLKDVPWENYGGIMNERYDFMEVPWDNYGSTKVPS